jgi:hypothetical protein
MELPKCCYEAIPAGLTISIEAPRAITTELPLRRPAGAGAVNPPWSCCGLAIEIRQKR